VRLVRSSGAAQSWEWPVDLAVSAVLTFAVLAELVLRRSADPIDFVAAPVLTSTVAWRRRAPQLAVVVGLCAALVLRDHDPLAQTVLLPVVVMLVFYMLGRQCSQGRRWAIDVVLLLVTLPTIWLTPGDAQPTALISVWLFFFALPYLIGRTIGSQSLVAEGLEQEAAQAEIDQRNAANRAVSLERTRIARDLHDVVAHNVSVMAIQAVAARRTAPTDPETARQALAAVASCGRDALIEMRRMIGALHRSDLDLATAWEPGLDQVHLLAQRARLGGVEVEVHVLGSPVELTPARDLVAFRVLQEALTNVVKHAGASRADVTLRYLPTSVEIDVDDDGAGDHSSAGGRDVPPGYGLLGMRERLALFGGTLSTRPGAHGGFEVRASIPRSEVALV
jgi:signal transduction histidine kinase